MADQELPISLEECVSAVLLADAPLVDYFASRGRSLEEALFRPMRALDDQDPADVLGPNTAKPFLIMQMGGEGGTSSDVTNSQFNIEMFDDTDNRYNELRKMGMYLCKALDRKFMGATQSGYTQWFRTEYNYTSPPTTDPEYECDLMFVRFQVYGG